VLILFNMSKVTIKIITMIQNMPKVAMSCTVMNVLVFLSSIEDTFYLTGSRFFGGDRLDSDWDFFTKSEISTKYKLKNLGFKEIDCEVMKDLGYDGDQFSTIMEYKAIDGIIQIQLVENCETS
jgi:hypothetical protein